MLCHNTVPTAPACIKSHCCCSVFRSHGLRQNPLLLRSSFLLFSITLSKVGQNPVPQQGKCKENPKHCTVSSVAPHGSTRPCKMVLILKLILFWQCTSPTDFSLKKDLCACMFKEKKELAGPSDCVLWNWSSEETVGKVIRGIYYSISLNLGYSSTFSYSFVSYGWSF